MNKKVILGLMLLAIFASALITTFDLPLVRAQEPPIEIPSDYTLDRDITFAGNGFIVKANNVTLDLNGHTITGSGVGMGVSLAGVNGISVKNGKISNFSYGIYLQGSSNTVTGNTIVSNHMGIYFENAIHNFLRDNNMTDNVYSLDFFHGYTLSEYIHDIDASNTVNGKPVYYWVNQHNKQIPTDAGYVGVINSSDIVVKDCILTNSGQGVLLAFTSKTTIRNINAFNNSVGIQLILSNYNTILGNQIMNSTKSGISSVGDGNTILGNQIMNSTDSGIESLGDSNIITRNNIIDCGSGIWLSGNGFTITANYIMNAIYGIYLWADGSTVTQNYIMNIGSVGIEIYNAYDNTIGGNMITDSRSSGIHMWYSHYNTIRGNMIANGDYSGIEVWHSENNTLYYNGFIGNTKLVDGDTLTKNKWDDGGLYKCPVCGVKRPKGNYWSDYRGVDDGSSTQVHNCPVDGIGDTDTPHLGVDKYPLMSLWIPLTGDINLDGTVDIYDAILLGGNYGKTV